MIRIACLGAVLAIVPWMTALRAPENPAPAPTSPTHTAPSVASPALAAPAEAGHAAPDATAPAADVPLRTARSASGAYLLEIEPGRADHGGRSCRATLWEADSAGAPRRRVWLRPLVNDVAPERALIRNDGKYVVTLDEFAHGGQRNALVVYGGDGRLLRHFLLTDLLSAADWARVVIGPERLDWRGGAQVGFDDDGRRFVVRLASGATFSVDLETLQLVRPAGAPPVDASAAPPAAVALLRAPLPAEDDAPAPAPARDIPALRPAETPAVDAVAAAIAGRPTSEPDLRGDTYGPELPAPAPRSEPTSQPAPASQPAPSPQAEPAAPAAQTPQPVAPASQPSAEHKSAPESRPTAKPARPGPPTAPATAAPSGDGVPAPNPAAKTDYVAWINAQGHVDGPDAGPLYVRLAGQLVAWRGTPDVRLAATRGQPAALAAPALKEWLAANAAALDTFRSATQCGVRGWRLESPDGSLVAVRRPEIDAARTAARLCVIVGRESAAEGHYEEAAERYLDAGAAGAHLAAGVTLSENLMGVALESMAAEALLDLLAEEGAQTLDRAYLLGEVEAALRPPQPLTRAARGERAFFLDTLQRMFDASGSAPPVLNAERAAALLAHLPGVQPKADVLLAELRDVGYETAERLGQAYFDAIAAALATPYAEAAQHLAAVASLTRADQGVNPLLRELTPDPQRFLYLWARGELSRRGALLVCHLWAQQAAATGGTHGQAWPETLGALETREFARDPFGTGPLHYRRTADGFELYSVGPDGQDDGGRFDRGRDDRSRDDRGRDDRGRDDREQDDRSAAGRDLRVWPRVTSGR